MGRVPDSTHGGARAGARYTEPLGERVTVQEPLLNTACDQGIQGQAETPPFPADSNVPLSQQRWAARVQRCRYAAEQKRQRKLVLDLVVSFARDAPRPWVTLTTLYIPRR